MHSISYVFLRFKSFPDKCYYSILFYRQVESFSNEYYSILLDRALDSFSIEYVIILYDYYSI